MVIACTVVLAVVATAVVNPGLRMAPVAAVAPVMVIKPKWVADASLRMLISAAMTVMVLLPTPTPIHSAFTS